MIRGFQTTDPDLAAYLYASAFRPLRVVYHRGRPAFTFPAEASLSAEAFYAGAAIPAKNLLCAVHKLASMRRVNQHEYICA